MDTIEQLFTKAPGRALGAALVFVGLSCAPKTEAPPIAPAPSVATSDVLPAPSGPTFRRGLNVNHWIGDNLPPSMLPNAHYGADWFDEEDVGWIAAQGFDHVRVWVAGHRWVAGDGTLDEAALAPFDQLLAWTKRAKLGVILAMHSTPRFRATVRGDAPPADASSPFADQATRSDAVHLWSLVAERYANEGTSLRFDLIARPEAPDAQSMQAFNRAALSAVRRSSPERVVHLTSHDEAPESAHEVDGSDPRTALSVRINLVWEAPAGAVTEPSLQDRAAVVAGVGRHTPREVYVAEFGVAKKAEEGFARAYLTAARDAFEARGLGWSVYDYHTAFAVRDSQGEPTRVVDALLNRPSSIGSPRSLPARR